MLTKMQAARILGNMKPLSEMLKDWREELKLTPAEGARRCKMSAQHYWQVEHGERSNLAASTLSKLADGTGIPLERLLKASELQRETVTATG